MVIDSLGLTNQHLEQQQAYYGRPMRERHRGVAYPGVFVLDEDGVVTKRVFEQSHRTRPSPGYLFRQVSHAPPRAARHATAQEEVVHLTAWLPSATFRPLEIHEVHVEIEVAEGWHLYTEPIPPGYTPLSVRLEADAELEAWPVSLPEGRPLTIPGLGEQFFVVDGSLRLSVPFKLGGAAYQLDGRERPEPGSAGPVTLDVEVGYQACSDRECLPPTATRLQLEIDEEASARRS